jgi:hypothetical protein
LQFGAAEEGQSLLSIPTYLSNRTNSEAKCRLRRCNSREF